MSSLRICVYNYKGGVGKTTLVVNTAAALAHPKHGNKKTLLIDWDPQCSTTQFFHDSNSAPDDTLRNPEDTETPAAEKVACNALVGMGSMEGQPSEEVEPQLVVDALHPECNAAKMSNLVGGDEDITTRFISDLLRPRHT